MTIFNENSVLVNLPALCFFISVRMDNKESIIFMGRTIKRNTSSVFITNVLS